MAVPVTVMDGMGIGTEGADHIWVPEEVGNGVISDHEMWVWSKFIHGVCHSHRMGTEEIEQVVSVYLPGGA